MSKYRVIKYKDAYYIQEKTLLFWTNIYVRKVFVYSDGDIRVHKDYMALSASSLEGAINILKKCKNNYLPTFKHLGHRIFTTFWYNDFIYVDEKTLLYSDSSEELCEKIALYEDEQKNQKNREKEERKKIVCYLEDE